MCSGSEDELSDTDYVVLVAEDETNEVDKAANQDEERSSIDDDEYPHLKLVASAERKRSHELEQEEATKFKNGTQMLLVKLLNQDQLCFAY